MPLFSSRRIHGLQEIDLEIEGEVRNPGCFRPLIDANGESLVSGRFSGSCDDFIGDITSGCSKLEKLVVETGKNKAITEIGEKSRARLRIVEIRDTRQWQGGLTDEGFKALAPALKEVIEMTLETTQLTQEGLIELIKSCQQLRRIRLP